MAEPASNANPDQLYNDASAAYAAALQRLARAYESDPDRCQDLLQEIHLALWRSLQHFDQRCSLRTWVYRVAHNISASHVLRQQRVNTRLVSLDEMENLPEDRGEELGFDRAAARERLLELIQRLKAVDRQVILSYLEGLDAASIGEITGISPAAVAMRIHRIKSILTRRFGKGGRHAG